MDIFTDTFFFFFFFAPDIRRARIRGNRKLNRNAIISIHRPISHSDPIDLEKSTREFNASSNDIFHRFAVRLIP